MRVILRTAAQRRIYGAAPGEPVEVPDWIARDLIAQEIALPVRAPEIEAAVREPEERAVVRDSHNKAAPRRAARKGKE